MPKETEIIVINTGPLVSLGRAGAFDIIQQLPLQFLTPQEVADEIMAGIRKGHLVEMPDWVQVISLSAPINLIAQKTLDAGEAAVIQLAIESRINNVCIDEWRGRRAAKAVGLQVTGSLSLLGRAKHLGIISEVRGWIERLIIAGAYYDSKLVHAFLQAMSEPTFEDKS